MAQHDYNIANQTGANFRADLNNALSAIASNNSGSSEPSTTFAYEWWIDTSANVLKLRNSANNAWITMPFSITADNTIDINAGTVNGITSFSFSSGATVTSILDEDNLASDSATALATQQSIKAYVDSQVTAQDLDISDGSSTIAIDLDSETLSLLGGTGVTSTASGNGVTFAIGQSVGTSDNVVFNQVTGALVGNASTATALATARTISGVSFDGTANITLDTDDIGEGTTNKYFTAERVDDQVNTLLTAGANISLTYDDTAGTLTIANTNSADITSVVAGDGLTGGGTSGDVTLAVGVDDSSIEISSDALRVKASGITNAMLAGSIANAKLSNSSVTVNSQAIALGGSHTFDTDDIGEGSSNIYYTDARANSAIDARVTNTFINNLTGVVADTATALATGRTIALSGDVTASGVSFDGTGNITLSTTIAANSVALGTDTTGNYVSTISGTTNEIEVSGSGSETATVTIGLPDDVTIAGNLTVNGTTTTVNSDTLSVTDPLIKLAKANSGADSLDIGFYGLYDTSGSQDLYAGLFRDANDSGKFKLFKDLQVEPTTTVNTSGTGYAVGTLVSNLEGNVTGNVTGNVSGSSGSTTGNAATATALATGRTIGMTGDVVWTSASFDGSGNVTGTATIQANSVALGTDTTGDYVGTITGGTGIDSSGATSGEGIAHTLSIDLNELGTETSIAQDDFVAMVDATDDGSGKITFSNLEDEIFGNVSGDIAIAAGGAATIQANSVALGTDTTGDYVSTITAGTGITSTGATSGEGIAHSLSVDASQTQITSVGALDAGSITSGFGSIDVGSSAITTTGTVTGNTLAGTLSTAAQTNITSVGTLTTLTVDDITIDGSTISDSGDLTVDVGGDIFLDAAGGQVSFKNNGTTNVTFNVDDSPEVLLAGGNAFIGTTTSDADLTIFGSDGGSNINALVFDMSEAGAATFNNKVTATELEIATSASDVGVDLTLNGNKSSNGAVASIIFENNTDSVAMIRASRVGGNNDAADMQFFTQATGGSNAERMRIDSSGNVGIGTASPSHQLEIESSSDADLLQVQSTAGSNDTALRLGIDGDVATINATGGSTGILGIKTYGTERMRIDSSGNVGIGSTTINAKFNVHGTIRAENDRFLAGREDAAAPAYAFHDDGDTGMFNVASNILAFSTAGSERMRIESGGDVAIGITDADSKLHTYQSAGNYIAHFESANANSYGVWIEAGASANNGYPLLQVTSNGGSDTHFRVDSGTGRTGFGTSSPQDTVDIRGNILQVGGSPEIHIGTTSASHYNWRIAAQEVVDTGFEIAVGTQSAGSDAASDTYTTKFVLLADGKCGINETNPLGILHIKDGDGGSFTPNESANTLVLEEDDNCGLTILSGNNDNGMIAFGDTNDSDVGSILYDHNASVLSFTVAASERMRIDSSGNVLVGTTSNQGVGGLTFGAGSNGINVTNNTTTGAGNGHEFYVFRRNSTQIGSIVMSNTDGVTYSTSSDARLKNVLGEAKGLEIVNKLNPVNFEWKESKKIQDGLIAQEVEELIPHAVAVSEEGHYSMDYSQVVTPLIKAIQEQQKEIEELKQNSHPPKTIEEMEGYEDLINRIKELENK